MKAGTLCKIVGIHSVMEEFAQFCKYKYLADGTV